MLILVYYIHMNDMQRVLFIYITLICLLLLTLYIYHALYLGSGSCIVYSTFYCSTVVDVSYVVNGEIKRPGRIITICCIKSWWLICKVFTFTIRSSEQRYIYRTVVIRYYIPGRINTTVEWLAVVSDDSYWWVWN